PQAGILPEFRSERAGREAAESRPTIAPDSTFDVRFTMRGRRTSSCADRQVVLHEMKRVADPYRDLDVIDSRAPRFNQATIGVLSLLAAVTGWWWLLAILGAQLVIGLASGRRFCLPSLVSFA